jgi:hypothetical protein
MSTRGDPVCRVGGCDEEFPEARAALGYTTCPTHWKQDPLNDIPPLILQDVNKSNPTITRRPEGFLAEQYAQREVRSELRQTRAYIQLSSTTKEERES